MRIKRLEIQGFKSFKDKTVIYFDRPITGIVGPNGSGKSNIVDAFFWVMGEQSYKHIRSSGSDDIIFKGSSKYQPLGLAEVTIVLEQLEIDEEKAPLGASADDAQIPMKKKEIAVTRRVYRGGEGEYFINGVQARLKDIQELFLDTGVGAKGYSVIEQGQIDKVVNSKPEDRRLLIEDAAGIAKYKARKRESLRKLDAAGANLTRLNDVLAEIERSLSSLERQAQRARKYKEYKDELLSKETTWARRKYQVLKKFIEKTESDKLALDAELVALKAELSQKENELEVSRSSQLIDSKNLEQVQMEVEELASQLNHHQSALRLSQQRQEDLSRQLLQLESERENIVMSIEQQKEQIAQKSEKNAQAQLDLNGISTHILEQEKTLEELRKAYELNQNEADQNRHELVSITQKNSQAQSEIAALKERKASFESAQTKLGEEQQSLSERKVFVENALREVTEKLEAIQAEQETVLRQLDEVQKNVEQYENNFSQLKQARDTLLKEVTTATSKLKTLEDFEKAREGMTDGPKKVLNWAQEQGRPLSVVSDFIHVDEGYDVAVSAVLGHTFERILVQDPDLAYQALHYLKSNEGGVASIQIAETLAQSLGSSKAVHHSLLSHVKFVQPQGRMQAEFQLAKTLVENLLSSVEVLEEQPHSGDISEYQIAGISFVTRAGIWFDAKLGVLYGGSSHQDLSTSILSRKRAIEELTLQVRELELKHADAENRLQENEAQLETQLTQQKALESRRNDVFVARSTYEAEHRRAQQDLEQADLKIKNLEQEQNLAATQVQELEQKITQLQGLMEGSTSRAQYLQSWVDAHHESLAQKSEELKAASETYQGAKIEQVSLESNIQSLNREIENEKRYLLDKERRTQEIERLLEEFNESRTAFTQSDFEHEEAVTVFTRSLSEKRESLSLVKDKMAGFDQIVSSAMERIKELHQLGDSKTSALNQTVVDFERHQSDLSHLMQNMNEKYGADWTEQVSEWGEQIQMEDPIITLEMSAEEEKQLHEEVESLRDRMRRLGEVNPHAVEEYDEMQKRFEHLRTEKQDLEQSMDHLNSAIEHINKTSEERFQKAYDAIKERFEKLFPIIFGGGQAQMSLVYPEGSTDILEAGVDILAQPPGKKISNMTLLSGGEKALTAISMIFAIFMVKPSPFCILDEVDAPLDDSNIGKFNTLVREMSAKSQFILVTHNKKTMELNDALYGVTMEEPGVSKMLSIQLQ